MGYEVSREMQVTFPKTSEKEVFEAINDLMDNPPSSGFKWGPSGAFSPEECDLADVFEEWRYELEEDGDNYSVCCFNGEKEGDDNLLWRKLAPLLNEGSYIITIGEDGTHYKWEFNEGEFEEKYGEVSYGD